MVVGVGAHLAYHRPTIGDAPAVHHHRCNIALAIRASDPRSRVGTPGSLPTHPGHPQPILTLLAPTVHNIGKTGPPGSPNGPYRDPVSPVGPNLPKPVQKWLRTNTGVTS